MRKFRVTIPDKDGNPVEEIWTEEKILHNYFAHWANSMRNAKKELEISEENCIEDFIAVNWAEEI